MKNIITFIIFSSILISCGGGNRSPASSSQGEIGRTIELGGSLSERGQSLATDICYALRAKRTSLSTFHSNQYKLELSRNNCDKTTSSQIIDVKITATDKRLRLAPFNTNESLIVSSIFTDQSEGMKHICEAIFTGETPESTIQSSSDLLIRTSFPEYDDSKFVRLEYATRSFTNTGEVTYTITSFEDYRIHLGSQFKDILPEGTAKEIIYTNQCPEESKADEFSISQKLKP